MGTESNCFESNSSAHNKIIVNSCIWHILAKFDYWQYFEFPKKIAYPPPKCEQRSNCFKMLHFEHFDVILKIEPDLRWLMSQKVLFWWWAHILRFTSRWIFNVFFFAEKFSIMIDFQKGQNCLRNSPKCLLKRHLFLENTKLLVSNRYMTLTHFKTKCCLDDDKSSIFDVEIGHNAAFQA